MSRILILTDMRGYLASSRSSDRRMVNVEKIMEVLRNENITVELKSIHSLKFPTKYRGWYVVYPSSEDPGLFYKDFLEDILLRLRLDGAILLPGFELFRAHHNKVFMELYRTMLPPEYNSIKTKVFYDVRDFEDKAGEILQYPIVLKTSEGSSSEGVMIAKDKKEAVNAIKHSSGILFFSSSDTLFIKLKRRVKRIISRLEGGNKLIFPQASGKMIAQAFIPGLLWDYKVLVYGDKYYTLRRNVRENDFRASGSGKFEFPENINAEVQSVLEYASALHKKIHSPLLSVDIAYDGKICHLIEFQCVNFGPYTLEYSKQYYVKREGGWEIIRKESVLEEEMAYAYSWYIKNQKLT